MKTQLLRILVSTVICLRNVDLVNCESNIVPKTFKSRFGGSKTIGLGVAGAAALAAFKYIQDGPKFDEPVSLAGQNIAITGANTGLGKEAALKLASLGARVILLCRPSKKTDDTVAEIKKATGSEQVEAVPLDLTDLASVSQCAQTLRKKLDKLDVLMNNAGVMAIPTREETRDGFEKQIGTNHLGHFLLTAELMNLLKRAPAARVVTVSSTAHQYGRFDATTKADLQLTLPGAYQPWRAYGNSKLANILFTRSLAGKLKEAGSNIIAVCCHPGVCRTELGRYIINPDSVPAYIRPILAVPLLPLVYLTKSAFQGAQTQIFLAATSSLQKTDSGLYFDNSKVASTSTAALSDEDAEWLWNKSETLVGKSFRI